MSLMELQRVENFMIKNKHGAIWFQGQTDLSKVDLADIVTIGPMFVEVYNDERHKTP